MISGKRFKTAVRPRAPLVLHTAIVIGIATTIAGAAVGTACGAEGVASAAGGTER
jgi:hypothetical protein